jgi:hypothetical protein
MSDAECSRSDGQRKRIQNQHGEKSMINSMRTALIAPGRTGDALAFANQVAKHIKEKYGTTLELLMPIGGNPGRIAWASRYQSLGVWETLSAKLIADSDYLGMIAKNASTFLPGSVHDELWRTI